MDIPHKLKNKAKRAKQKKPAQDFFASCHSKQILDDEIVCLASYIYAARLIFNDRSVSKLIASEILFLENLQDLDPSLKNQLKLYLEITKYLAINHKNKGDYQNNIEHFKLTNSLIKTPVLVIAGGASLMDESTLEAYNEFFIELMHGFEGTIISGGTTAGIPGMVGAIKTKTEKKGALDFSLIAYLPHELPPDATRSLAYDHFYETESTHFSALDILSYWCDLIGNRINPADVFLIGIDGGSLAALEYRIALSVGAKVGLMTHSGRAVDDLLQDNKWKNYPNLILLPENPVEACGLIKKSIKRYYPNKILLLFIGIA